MNPLIASTQETLKRLGSATLYEANGQRGAFDNGIKPIHPDFKLAGIALTIDSWPGDNLMLHHALTLLQAGQVVVMDAKGFMEGGHSGDTTAYAAMVRGGAGFVVDGAVRDAEAVIALRYPVFARGLSIKTVSKNQLGRVNIPITCGGTIVHPGDVIVGDRDGIVTIPSAEIVEVIARAEERERKETRFRNEIKNGKTTAELIGVTSRLSSLS